MGFSLFSLVLPMYDQKRYDVQYDLYIDMEKKKGYHYSFIQQVYIWAPLVLVAWVNFSTPSEQEALTATMFQFFRDAQRDNYLATHKVSGPDRLVIQ